MEVFPGSPQQLQLVRAVQQGVDALLSVVEAMWGGVGGGKLRRTT